MRKLIAMWNGVRGVWEKPGTVSLLCEHSELFSETWPTSGTMRNGRAFELPMQVLPTIDTGFSFSPIKLLRTVVAGEVEGGPTLPAKARAKGQTVRLTAQTLDKENWEQFRPAIKRWEEITSRLAPEPTLPDGQKGQERLSAKFTEWLMGLPDGWITSNGLHRKDEIKMAGNGVVPQQAMLALKMLKERFRVE